MEEDQSVRLYLHNLVFRFRLSPVKINRQIIALTFGGLYSSEDHAGPTSIAFSGPVNCHIRMFKENKVIISGCKSRAAADIAIWTFCAKISLVLSQRGIMTPVYPLGITQTNTMATGYYPYTLDLQGIARDLNELGQSVEYDPSLIKYARVYYKISGRKITLGLSPTGAIVFMGGEPEIIYQAIDKILPVLKANRLEPADPLLKRKIKVDVDGSEEICETERTKKRRKKRKISLKRKK